MTPPATITVHQGDDVGRPVRLEVAIPAGIGRISVTGRAVRMDAV